MIRSNIHRSRSAGFSLVELMLALALGLVVVTGIVQLFVGNSQTYNILTGQARMQESARFALEFISQAARSAGYFGCSPQAENLMRGLRGDWDELPEFDVTRIVQAEDDVEAGWNPSWVPHTAGTAMEPDNAISIGDIQLGTDFVAFRGMRRPGRRLADPLPPTEEPVIATLNGDAGIEADDVVIVADCQQGAVFRVAAVVPDGAGRARLEYVTSSSGDPYVNAEIISTPAGPAAFSMSVIGRPYGEDATVGVLESTFFYVAAGAGEDAAGDPVPALWQKVGNNLPVELVQGIEDLQILYGVDNTLTDDLPNANAYVEYDELPDPNDPSAVVSLRVTVVATSIDGVTDEGEPLRRAFSKTILLRNARPEAG